jgi:hypothetical protein
VRRAALVLLLASLAPLGRAADPDEERAAWQRRRSVTLVPPSGAPPFASLPLPPEVAAKSQTDLRDLRLVGSDGLEVPYVLDRHVEREVIPTWTGTLVDTARDKKVRSVWVIDLQESAHFDRLDLDIREQDFAKRVKVEVSADRQAWRLVREDAGIFDRPWSLRVHHTSIEVPERVTARWVRLTADDTRSRPIEVTGVIASDSRRVPGSEWARPVALEPIRSSRPGTHYRLDLPEGLSFETLHLDAEDPGFCRKVVILERRERNGEVQEAVLGEGVLYRLRLPDELLSGEALALDINGRQHGDLILEVQDGDSPPLRKIRGVVSSPATRLLFPVFSGSLTLYYGNDATRAPIYDIEGLKGRLGANASFVPASIGAEADNPRYRKAPPLAFTAARGASLQTPRWRAVRRFDVAGADDIYSLTLDPQDMGLLEADLRDVRVVDAQDRQVPCTVEPQATEKRVALEVTRAESPKDRPATSRYRLAVPARLGGAAVALPISALELSFNENFFSRAARVLAPRTPGGAQRETVISQTLLARTPEQPRESPLVVALSGRALAELLLEIDEGDNAPLSISQAAAVVRVARVAFKAGPGPYRVLLGNPEAQAPRYDIASLRQEILAYSALPLVAAAAEANPAYRRSVGDYFKQAPPTAVLWGSLIGAVVGLAFLTVRILRQPPPAEE